MQTYPPLSTQVIGQAESALGALLRIRGARKIDGAEVEAAIAGLAAG